MSLHQGRPYLAIPGPSVVPDRVLAAMHRPSPNIYTGPLIDMTRSLFPDLKALVGTQHDMAIYITNGHGTWEASLSNVVSPGDTVLVLGTGAFCLGWGGMARDLGLKTQILDFGNQSDIDLTQVEAALRADTDHQIKAVLAVHVDTSTSVKNDVAGLRKTLDLVGHPALMMIDCIASLGCDEYRMDDWGADVTIAACQKGLMTPAGVGFVFFNDRAAAARENCQPSQYWDWKPRANADEYWQHFDGTAPTHHLYGLREALNMIKEEGLEALWARHAALAGAIWAAVDVWGQTGEMTLNIATPEKRSNAVTSIAMTAPNADRLRAYTETVAGVTLGIGLGRDPASGYFRIGHMGHVSAHMIMGMLGAIDMGLKALNIPHGAGALDAASQHLCDAAAQSVRP